jgi:hypothetical protein
VVAAAVADSVAVEAASAALVVEVQVAVEPAVVGRITFLE